MRGLCARLPNCGVVTHNPAMSPLPTFFHHRRLPAALLFGGALLRLLGLGRRSLWLDEAFSVVHAAQPAAALWAGQGDLNHPPLYYLLLHGWLAWGSEPAWVRLPSALASVAGLLLFYLLARRLTTPGWAAWGLLLLALAPLDIWYAQEARMYALVGLAGLLTALGLATPGWRGGLLAAGGTALGLYTDYSFLPLLALLLGVFLAWRPNRPVAIGLALGALAAAPLLPRLWQLAGRLNDIHTVVALRGVLDLPPLPAWLPLLAFPLVMAVTAVLLREIRRRPLPWLAALLLVGLLALTLLLPLPRLYSLKRLLAPAWPLLLLGATLLAARATRPPLLRALPVATALAALLLFFVPKDDWAGASAYVTARAPATALIWVDPFVNQLPYNYYQPQRPAGYGTAAALAARAADRDAVWLVTPRFPGDPIPGAPAERYLDQAWTLAATTDFYRLQVRVYARR